MPVIVIGNSCYLAHQSTHYYRALMDLSSFKAVPQFTKASLLFCNLNYFDAQACFNFHFSHLYLDLILHLNAQEFLNV